MRWIKDEPFYVLVLLLLILIIALRTPLDSDMWWHLRAGEETLTSGIVYKVDSLSYTRAGQSWVNHSWLSQIVMIGLFNLGGYKALSLWVGIAALGSMYFVYLQMEGHALLRAGITLFAAFVCSVVWSPRPQIFSLLLFALSGLILFRYKWQGKNQLVWFIPLFIVWSNLHGGYILGIILIGSMVAGEIYNRLVEEKSDTNLSWKQIKELTLWGCGGFALAVVNPNGISMWLIPFQTVGVETLQNLIQEWASPDFHQPVQQLLLILLFGTFAAVGLSKRRLDGSDLASFSVFGILALTARRNFGPFAIVAAPILVRHLNDLFSSWKVSLVGQWKIIQNLLEFQQKSEKGINKTLQLIVNTAVVLLLIASAGFKWISVTKSSLVSETEKQMFPLDAVAWLKEENPSGRMFNSYNWGGYLTWKLREYPVFVDGRTDLYGDEIISSWVHVIDAEEKWEDIIEEWGISIILVERGQNIIKVLENSGWTKAYQDTLSVIYTR
jgi:hypothetical protein